MSKTSCHYFKWVFLVDLWYTKHTYNIRVFSRICQELFELALHSRDEFSVTAECPIPYQPASSCQPEFITTFHRHKISSPSCQWCFSGQVKCPLPLNSTLLPIISRRLLLAALKIISGAWLEVFQQPHTAQTEQILGSQWVVIAQVGGKGDTLLN